MNQIKLASHVFYSFSYFYHHLLRETMQCTETVHLVRGEGGGEGRNWDEVEICSTLATPVNSF